MFCPKCGDECTDQANFCANCGAMLASAPVSAAPEEQTEKKDLLAWVKPLLEKVTPFLKKNMLFVVGGLGIVACVICIALLCAIFGGGNGFYIHEHNIDVMVNGGEVVIVYDAKKAKSTGMEATSISRTQSSMDGSVLAFVTSDGELAVVKGTKLSAIAEDVDYFAISVDGTGIAYAVKDEEGCSLYLYNVKTKKTKEVTNHMAEENFSLSPNGDSLCYYEANDDKEPTLMYFKGSKNTKITSSEVYLVGLSNNGKYIFAIAEDDEGKEYVYSYNTKGSKKKIGACNAPAFYFNADHTQLVYFYGDEGYKTYISTNGKEGKKIASSIATPLLPSNVEAFTSSYTATVPTDDLYNKVYTCQGESGSNVWLIRKNADNSVKLVNNVSRVTLSQDGKFVYYVDDSELMVLEVKKGEHASDRAKVLAEDVSSYVVTSDSKKLYYTSDNALYCVNAKTGRGKKTVANDEVSFGLYINGNDVVYFVKDGDCYATKNGSKGKLVVSDATSLEKSANGVVYIKTDSDVYATSSQKKPTKVFTQD